jgi:DNA-binding MarR family transcriptional regulator
MDETRWLSTGQIDDWVHLSALVAMLPVAIEDQLKRDSGLSRFEYDVLVQLAAAPGRAVQMATLAQYAHVSQSRLSHAVSRMERAGWIGRRSCSAASRAVEAVLTDAGFAELERAAPGHVAEVRRTVVDVLTPEEFDQLRLISRKILRAAAPETLENLDRLLAE